MMSPPCASAAPRSRTNLAPPIIKELREPPRCTPAVSPRPVCKWEAPASEGDARGRPRHALLKKVLATGSKPPKVLVVGYSGHALPREYLDAVRRWLSE